ncbi:hypothetical protein [Tolypothrix sp. VBCCA 56010]|uniref:hypothetical protein n=1 Tax=Tolypothrix sp. VBCCA 56010 TaxID=3137731 RepID=UPI003D7E82A5
MQQQSEFAIDALTNNLKNVVTQATKNKNILFNAIENLKIKLANSLLSSSNAGIKAQVTQLKTQVATIETKAKAAEVKTKTIETKVANLEKDPRFDAKVLQIIQNAVTNTQNSVNTVNTNLVNAVTRLTELEKLPVQVETVKTEIETIKTEHPKKWGITVTEAEVRQAEVTKSTDSATITYVDRKFAQVTESQFSATEWVGRYGKKAAYLVDYGVDNLNNNDKVLADAITATASNIDQQIKFYNVMGYSRKNLAVVYGSKFDTAPPVAGHPQLFLHFSQDGAAQPIDEPLIEHEKSCRLMKFSCSSEGTKSAISRTDMTAIANKIKTLFLDNKKGITYTTGNKSASYTDPDNGFAKGNYLLVNSKADAVNIYSKICNAIDVPYRGDSHIILNDPDKASTTTATAGKTTILGKLRNNRRYRPVAILRFRYAYISLGNLISPIFLIDTTLRNQSLVEWL